MYLNVQIIFILLLVDFYYFSNYLNCNNDNIFNSIDIHSVNISGKESFLSMRRFKKEIIMDTKKEL